ncbi:MAG: MliC family protein [Brachymonas sp.]|nr:MliC family protein [Brachymonas sp.]
MKKLAALGASLAGALVLGACSVSMPYTPPQQQHHHHHQGHVHHGHSHSHGHHHHQPKAPMMDKRFSCQNGLTVNIRHLGGDQVELRLDNKRAVLKQAVSGSGERYVAKQGLFGRGAEWHQKGNEGHFSFVDPYGNAIETSCRAMN